MKLHVVLVFTIVVIFLGFTILFSFDSEAEKEDIHALIQTPSASEQNTDYVDRLGSSVELSPIVYRDNDNEGYQGVKASNLSYGALSKLRVSDNTLKNHISRSGYTVFADPTEDFTVELIVGSYSPGQYLGGGKEYRLSDDTWTGKIHGIERTGQVKSGVFLVRTSTNGYDWKEPTREGIYEYGLFTSDFLKNTEVNKTYKPLGLRVLSGVYIDIVLAYEVCTTEYAIGIIPYDKYYNIVEEYKLYVVSDSPDRVAIHNLSAYEGEDHSIIETMGNAFFTHTGFEVDKRLCPLSEVKIMRDGYTYYSMKADELTYSVRDIGYYSISINSPLGNHKKVDIIVAPSELKSSLDFFFGGSPIDGIRIYDKNSGIPVYLEGSKIDIWDTRAGARMSGLLYNQDTGETITIDTFSTVNNDNTLIPGHYVLKLSLNNEGGDIWSFRFTFKVISLADAPSPWMNREQLSGIVDLRDVNAKLYGSIIYTDNGHSLIAVFPTEKEAYQFAYSFLEGGSKGSLHSDARAYYCKDKVFTKIADLYSFISNEATASIVELDIRNGGKHYATIADDLTFNQYFNFKLDHDVYVITDPLLFDDFECHPVISNHIQALYYGYHWTESSNVMQFHQFDGGVDSSHVYVQTQSGWCELKYGIDIVSQFEKIGIDKGIVLIKEVTSYGRETTYEADYF